MHPWIPLNIVETCCQGVGQRGRIVLAYNHGALTVVPDSVLGLMVPPNFIITVSHQMSI